MRDPPGLRLGGQHSYLENLRVLHPVEVFRAIDGRRPNAPPKVRKKELVEAQRHRKETLKRQIRRAQSRITTAQRKRRTRRLILMGSYLEHVTGDDPGKRDSLMKGLDVFLERERDRELFDLAPHKENADGNPG